MSDDSSNSNSYMQQQAAKNLTISAKNERKIEEQGHFDELPGGITRFRIGRVDENPPPPEMMRSGVHDGTNYRTTPEGTVEAFGAVTQYTYPVDRDPGNPLAYVRGSNGRPAVRVTPDCIIAIGGMDTSIAAAIGAGYVRPDGNGYAMTDKWRAEFGKPGLTIR
jgi:hypothetical protein